MRPLSLVCTYVIYVYILRCIFMIYVSYAFMYICVHPAVAFMHFSAFVAFVEGKSHLLLVGMQPDNAKLSLSIAFLTGALASIRSCCFCHAVRTPRMQPIQATDNELSNNHLSMNVTLQLVKIHGSCKDILSSHLCCTFSQPSDC